MKEIEKTPARLIAELASLKRQVAELKVDNAALAKANERYLRLVDYSPCMIFRLSLPDGRYEYVSEGSLSVTGYSPREILSDPLFIRRVIHPDFLSYFDDKWERLLAGQADASYEYMITDPAGGTRWLHQKNVLIRDRDGRPSFLEAVVTDITDRKRTEEEARKNRLFLSELIEHSGALICVKDRNGRYELINRKWEAVTGLNRQTVLGRTDEELFPGPVGRQFRLNDLEVMEAGTVLEKEEILEDGNGKRHFISVKVPMRGDDGEVAGLCGMITEITARKEAEEALGVSRNRLSRAEIISRSGNWEFDMKSKRVLTSEGALRIYGLNGDQWTIPEVQKLVLPEYRDMLDRALRNLIQENRPYDVEFKIARPDTGRIIDIHSVAEYDREREVVFGIIQDITDYKRAEEALLLNGQRTQALLHLGQMTEATLKEITDFALEEAVRLTQSRIGYLAFLNDDESVLTMHSWSKSAMAECAITDKPIHYPLADTGLWGEAVRQRKPIITNDYAAPNPWKKSFPEGHIRISRHMNVPIFAGSRIVIVAGVGNKKDEYTETDTQQLTLLMQGMLRLIERRRAQEELHESRRRLEDLIEFLPDATLVIDREGKVLAWNRAIEAMTGVRKEEMLGKGRYEYALPFYGERRPILIDYVLNPDGAMEEKYTTIQRSGETISAEAFAPRLPPGDVHLQATASVLRDSKGGIIAAIECIRDNTERKRLAERLNRAEKMEGLGRLAGGVAHDLNNILGVLVGYSELLREKLPEGSSLKRYADSTMQAGLRGAAIIQDLLTLARRGVAVSEVVNLNGIVSDYLKTPEFEKLKSEHWEVEIRIDLTAGLPNIKGSPLHLSKTIVNLVSNAAEAISGQGEITIKTENRYLDAPVRGYDDIREGDYAILTVSDTGKGISPEDMEKIFEPFYTRKVMGRSGTGLGLALVWGTVKDHRGYIDVVSEEGKGSVFTLYLPVCREEALKRKERADSAAYMGKGEAILVVDDVKEQRELAVSMMERLGYRVAAAAGGEEAIEYLCDQKADLLVLDMIMDPGIDGLETYRRVLEMNPRQKAIIVSGFSETDRVRQAQEMGAGAFVRKPYILEKIGLAIRRELDRP